MRIWFFDRLAPNEPLYNLAFAHHLSGEIDVVLLEDVFRDVLNSHEVFRTSVYSMRGVPMQKVGPPIGRWLTVVDLAADPYPLATLDDRLADLARKPFDLEQGPLARFCLYVLGRSRYCLGLCAHHLIVDGRTLQVIWEDVSRLYAARAYGGARACDDVKPQFLDVAGVKDPRREERDLQYWTGHLDGFVGSGRLVPRRDGGGTSDKEQFTGATLPIMYGEPFVRAVDRAAADLSVTTFSVLLAAFAWLMSRECGQQDLVIGTPVDLRTSRYARVAGCLTNTLPLRLAIDDRMSFAALIRHTSRVVLEGVAHRHLPFQQIVGAALRTRQIGDAALDALFGLQPRGTPSLALPGVVLDRVCEVSTGCAKFPLNIALMDSNGAICGSVEYRLDSYSATDAQRLVDSYRDITLALVNSLAL